MTPQTAPGSSMDLPPTNRRAAAIAPFWSGPIEITPLSGGSRTRTSSSATRRAATWRALSRAARARDRPPQRGRLSTGRRAARAGARARLPRGRPRSIGTCPVGASPRRTLGTRTCSRGSGISSAVSTTRGATWSGTCLYFCPFQTIRTYAHAATALNARLPAHLDHLLEMPRSAGRIGLFRPRSATTTSCPRTDRRRRAALAGGLGIRRHGPPLFDLASVSANAGLTEDEEPACSRPIAARSSREKLEELRVFKAASVLREALWALIQTVASELDFDYHAYADAGFTLLTRTPPAAESCEADTAKVVPLPRARPERPSYNLPRL